MKRLASFSSFYYKQFLLFGSVVSPMNLQLSHTVSSSDIIVHFPPEVGTLGK